MNILLICPRAGELVGKHPSFLPLGVAYLAAVLEQDGHRVEVVVLWSDGAVTGWRHVFRATEELSVLVDRVRDELAVCTDER